MVAEKKSGHRAQAIPLGVLLRHQSQAVMHLSEQAFVSAGFFFFMFPNHPADKIAADATLSTLTLILDCLFSSVSSQQIDAAYFSLQNILTLLLCHLKSLIFYF